MLRNNYLWLYYYNQQTADNDTTMTIKAVLPAVLAYSKCSTGLSHLVSLKNDWTLNLVHNNTFISNIYYTLC